jgi:hypothetical protein
MKKGSCNSFETVSAAGVVAVVAIRCSHEVEIIVGIHNISAYLNYIRNARKGQGELSFAKSLIENHNLKSGNGPNEGYLWPPARSAAGYL